MPFKDWLEHLLKFPVPWNSFPSFQSLEFGRLSPPTVNLKLDCSEGTTSTVLSSASIKARMTVSDRLYGEHASSTAQLSCRNAWLWGDDRAMQWPAQLQRFITSTDNADNLGKLPLIHGFFSKGDWKNLRWFCNKTVRQIFLDQQIKSQWYFVWFVSLFVFLNSASYPWLSSPLTFSSTLSDLDPAEFEAVQVYLPLWR